MIAVKALKRAVSPANRKVLVWPRPGQEGETGRDDVLVPLLQRQPCRPPRALQVCAARVACDQFCKADWTAATPGRLLSLRSADVTSGRLA